MNEKGKKAGILRIIEDSDASAGTFDLTRECEGRYGRIDFQIERNGDDVTKVSVIYVVEDPKIFAEEARDFAGDRPFTSDVDQIALEYIAAHKYTERKIPGFGLIVRKLGKKSDEADLIELKPDDVELVSVLFDYLVHELSATKSIEALRAGRLSGDFVPEHFSIVEKAISQITRDYSGQHKDMGFFQVQYTVGGKPVNPE